MTQDSVFDFYLKRNYCQKGMEHYLSSLDKEELVLMLLKFYDQEADIYNNLSNWKYKIPMWYTEYLGINHDWNSQNANEWLDMFIELVERSSDLAQLDTWVLADLESENSPAYSALIASRAKWAPRAIRQYCPISLFGKEDLVDVFGEK